MNTVIYFVTSCGMFIGPCLLVWRGSDFCSSDTRHRQILEWWRLCQSKHKLISVVKWFRYRPGLAQSVGRGIALLFHYRGTRSGWVVSSATRPHFTPGKDPVHVVQDAGWVPGPVWTGGKSRPHRDPIPDHPARSQSLYRLSYLAHVEGKILKNKYCLKRTNSRR